MDNLINFDDEVVEPAEVPRKIATPLIPSRNSIELAPDPSNPYEAAESAAHSFPFDFLKPNDDSLHLTDGDNFSFDCFSNVTSVDSLSKDSSVISVASDGSLKSDGSGKTVVSRSLSDSSTISAKSDNNSSIVVNRSLDSSAMKHNQLLKLSFYNSSNSPMKNEAKKIAKQLNETGHQNSFEDLNNVTPDLVDISTDSVICDDDIKNFKVNTYDLNSKTLATPSSKIQEYLQTLDKIKKEVDGDDVIDLSVDVKEEFMSPRAIKTEKTDEVPEIANKGDGDKSSEFDEIYSRFKSVLSKGNRDEAKKQLAKLNEMLGTNQEPKNMLTVQPIVRQATFEIDKKTGEKRSSDQEAPAAADNGLMEKLALLFKNQTLDVRSMGDATGAKIVVVVPSMSSTPQKSPPRQALSAIRHKSAFKATDAKKFTPTKGGAGRPSLSRTASKVPNPYEQKLSGIQSRAGAVRKSLLGSIDKTPQPPKTPVPIRRSVSLKASIPQTQDKKTSPTNSTPARARPSTSAVTPRPSTGAATPRPSVGTAPRTAAASRLTSSSTFVKPSTAKAPAAKKPPPGSKTPQFKTPATLRKAASVAEKGSLV